MVAGNIGSVFGWKCSLCEDRNENEMCKDTGEWYCGFCKGVHSRFEVCPKSIFRFPSKGFNYVILPPSVLDVVISTFQGKNGYNADGEKRRMASFFL